LETEEYNLKLELLEYENKDLKQRDIIVTGANLGLGKIVNELNDDILNYKSALEATKIELASMTRKYNEAVSANADLEGAAHVARGQNDALELKNGELMQLANKQANRLSESIKENFILTGENNSMNSELQKHDDMVPVLHAKLDKIGDTAIAVCRERDILKLDNNQLKANQIRLREEVEVYRVKLNIIENVAN